MDSSEETKDDQVDIQDKIVFKLEVIKINMMIKDGEYNKVGEIINNEKWSRARVAEFSAYFGKYLPTQANLLYKFL